MTFDSDSFDIDAYLARIGYAGERTPTLSALEGIVAGHATTIAFENLDPFLRRPVDLDIDALQAKLVAGGRGGYCFEQNLLLAHALRSLGFRVTGLAARVLWNRPADAPLPARGHMLLRVDLDGGPHLVDVGFGGQTLTGVLRLEADVAQPTPLERFRLWPVGEDFDMQAEVAGEWRTLYRFGLTEQLPSDYEVTSWYLSNHPESHFVTGLIVARPAEDRRFALGGRQLTVHHLGGPSEPRSIESPAELARILESDFLLDLSGLDGFEEAVARFWS